MANTLNYFHSNIDDFNDNCNICSKQLRILQWNIRGMNDLFKFDKITETLDQLKVHVDIIVVGETWVNLENSALYHIPGYTSVFSCRNTSSGGLAVYIRNSLNYKTVENKVENGMHHIHIQLKINENCYDIHGIYRPPSYDFNSFFDHLENWLSSSVNSRSCFVFGDMNVPVNLVNNNVVSRYKQLLQSYNFVCTNTFVTRPASSNILDHVICKIEDACRICNHTIFSDVSDHLLVLSEYKMSVETNRVTFKKNIVNRSQVQYEFRAYLQSIHVIDNVNTCLESIMYKYNEILANNTVTVTKTAKLKGSHCPWMNFEIWSLIKIKNNYLKRHRNNPSDSRTTELLKHVSKKVDILKKKTKKRYYENLLNSTCHSKLWKNINALFGASTKSSQSNLVINGVQTNSTIETCEVLNEHFSTIGSLLANNIVTSNVNPLTTVRSVSETIFVQPASADEVVMLIKDLKNNKSPGPDNLPTIAIQDNVDVFSTILAESFNKIIDSGRYPQCLKIAKVVPIFKSGDPSKPDNYRPISTLSVFNKIFEKLLMNRMVNFLERHNVIYNLQYGFRNGSSTTVAITELVDSIINDIDSKKHVGALFLDLKKAFDTLNHDILLAKLDRYGIRGTTNEVIRSYLQNRQQFVSIDGERSSLMHIHTGVPQGSNIGPLLFLLYINDICRIGLKGTARLFADDTALFYPNSNPHTIITDINHDLEKLHCYFTCNLLSLNLTKTKFMIFHSARKTLPQLISPKLGSDEIEQVSVFKYLGVHLDSILSWDGHIKHVCNKISSLSS